MIEKIELGGEYPSVDLVAMPLDNDQPTKIRLNPEVDFKHDKYFLEVERRDKTGIDRHEVDPFSPEGVEAMDTLVAELEKEQELEWIDRPFYVSLKVRARVDGVKYGVMFNLWWEDAQNDDVVQQVLDSAKESILEQAGADAPVEYTRSDWNALTWKPNVG